MTLLGDVPTGTLVVLTPDSASGEPPSSAVLLPDASDCVTQVEAPQLSSVAALVTPGAVVAPSVISAANGIAGSTIWISVNGAAFGVYAGPFLYPSCGSATVVAYATKPGAVTSVNVTQVFAPITAAPAAGALSATCASVSARSAPLGASAELVLGVAEGRDASCNVELTVQYAPASPPAGGAAAFRLVSPTAGNLTLVAAAGYDTTLNLGDLPGAPSFSLYTQTVDGSWVLADPAAAPVTVGLACQGQAAAPVLTPSAPDLAAPHSPTVSVTIASGYDVSLNSITFITTDGTDPSLTAGSRVWYSGAPSWTITMQVSCCRVGRGYGGDVA